MKNPLVSKKIQAKCTKGERGALDLRMARVHNCLPQCLRCGFSLCPSFGTGVPFSFFRGPCKLLACLLGCPQKETPHTFLFQDGMNPANHPKSECWRVPPTCGCCKSQRPAKPSHSRHTSIHQPFDQWLATCEPSFPHSFQGLFVT